MQSIFLDLSGNRLGGFEGLLLVLFPLYGSCPHRGSPFCVRQSPLIRTGKFASGKCCLTSPFQPHPVLSYPLEWPSLFEAEQRTNSSLSRFTTVAQRSCGWPIQGNVPDEAGWGSEQPGLVENVPAHGTEVGTQ